MEELREKGKDTNKIYKLSMGENNKTRRGEEAEKYKVHQRI
jgi:hypothetical protein